MNLKICFCINDQVSNIFSRSGREGLVKYDFRLTNFEVLLSTLPNIKVTSASTSSGTCNVNLHTDFSLNGQCKNVIQSRMKVLFSANKNVGTNSKFRQFFHRFLISPYTLQDLSKEDFFIGFLFPHIPYKKSIFFTWVLY